MELFDDPKIKRTYLKSKIRVKQWESTFMEKYGRKPNKVFVNFFHVYIPRISHYQF